MSADNASIKLISDDSAKKIADALTKEVAPATSGTNQTFRSTAGPLVPPVEEAKKIKEKEAEYDAFDPEGEYAEEAKEAAKKQAEADVAAKAAKDAEEAKKVEVEKKPAHSDRLMRLASTYGLSRVEAEGMTSEQLRNEIAEAKLEVETQELIARRKTAPVVDRPKATPEAPKEDEIDWGEIETYDAAGAVNGKRKATEADVHPALSKVIKEQSKALKQIQARQAEMDRASEFAIFDRAFGEAGKKFKSLLGDIPASDMDQNNADHQLMMRRRMAILQASGLAATDSAVTKHKKIVDAANMLLGPLATVEAPVSPPPPPAAPAKPVQKPAAEKTEKENEWEAGALTAPTATNGKQAKGREAAYKQYEQIFERVKQRDGDKEDGDTDAELDEFGFPAPRYN